MTRPTGPPPAEFFARRRPADGDGAFAIRMDGIRIEFEGIGADLGRRLRDRYGPFAVEASGSSGALRVAIAREDTDYFVTPPDRPEFNPVLLACDGDRIRYLGYRVAGWFDTLGGRGLLLLARGAYEPAERAVENFVRAAVAWQAASRGGALVHAASAVHEGRAYLFYGESGAGKSTLSACSERGRVVSDDLSLVLPGRSGPPDLVGAPFRGTYDRGDPVLGRFPVAAGFRIIKDVTPRVRAVPRVRAMAELVGNLPFVAEAFARRPDLLAGIERTFSTVHLGHLHFRKDDTYWDAVSEAGL